MRRQRWLAVAAGLVVGLWMLALSLLDTQRRIDQRHNFFNHSATELDEASTASSQRSNLVNFDEDDWLAASEEDIDKDVSTVSKKHFFRPGPLYSIETVIDYYSRQVDLLPPKARVATISRGATCNYPPDLSTLPRMMYQHRSPRRTELTAHELLDCLLDRAGARYKLHENVATFLSMPELTTNLSLSKRGGATQSQMFPPFTSYVLHRSPISFSDPLRFNVSVPFGLWHTYFLPDSEVKKMGKSEIKRLPYPQVLPPAIPMYYSIFSKAWAIDGNVVTCSRLFTTGACMWEHQSFPPPKKKHHAAAVVALCDKWCTGYFHFTHEHLPRVALVHHLLVQNSKVKITVPTKNPFVRQYMIDVLGLQPSQLLNHEAAHYADRVIYPQPQKCGSVFPSTLHLLRKIVFGRLGLTSHRNHSISAREDSDGGERYSSLETDHKNSFKILLAVRKSSRMPQNFNEIIEQLKQKYKTVLNSRKVVFQSTLGLNVTGQIIAFNRADMVIGPHGANIANAIWMRHGCYLLEFMSYTYANMCYYGSAARLGLRYGVAFHGSKKGGRYNITFDEIVMHIDTALDSHQL